MNKEQLIALGLTEEQADKVIDGFGQMVPKSRLDDKIQEANDLKEQLTDRDTQLTDLKKNVGDNAELKKQIEDLQSENKTKDEEYQEKLNQLSIVAALKLALANDVHENAMDMAVEQFDKSQIKLDDKGNIIAGYDDQRKAMQESKAFLFVEKQGDKPPAFKGFTPSDGKGVDDKGGKGDDDSNFGKQLAEFSKNNSGLEQARNSYFE